MLETNSILQVLVDICSTCKHDLAEHTWTYPHTQSQVVGCCGVSKGTRIDKLGNTHIANCRCDQFRAITPLEMCEVIEKRLEKKRTRFDRILEERISS